MIFAIVEEITGNRDLRLIAYSTQQMKIVSLSVAPSIPSKIQNYGYIHKTEPHVRC